jgi:uncharacterized protein YjbJ (UPF0337 family)
MNWDQVQGRWTEVKGRAREKWGDLTDDELEAAKGDREQLAGQIQRKYGKSKEEAEREVDEWMESL